MNTVNIKNIKDYFKNREDIAFAFLFGSHSRSYARKLSDVDIAVYFYPEKRHPVEYEAEKSYKEEDEIWDGLENLLKNEVDLLVLNRVSACVAASALRGIPLSIRDYGLYLDFMEVVTREAEDFTETALMDFMLRKKLAERT